MTNFHLFSSKRVTHLNQLQPQQEPRTGLAMAIVPHGMREGVDPGSEVRKPLCPLIYQTQPAIITSQGHGSTSRQRWAHHVIINPFYWRNHKTFISRPK
jgi:hypothetical protein